MQAVLEYFRAQRMPLRPAGLTLASLLIIVFCADLYGRYNGSILEAKKTARNFADVLSTQTALTFQTIERTLREAEQIRADLLDRNVDDMSRANEALRLLKKSLPMAVAIGITDRDGNVVAHSYEGKPPRDNISSMVHFTEQRDRRAYGLYVSPPYRSAVENKWFTAVSIRLTDRNGDFAGVVSAPIDQSYFTELYRSIDLGSDGSIILVHRNGLLLAREPNLESAIGRSLAHGAMFTKYLPKSDTGSYDTVSLRDGVPRVAGYKTVPGLPLIISVSYARSDILQPVYRHLLMFGPLLAVAIAAVLLGSFAMARQTRRLTEKSRGLESALNELGETNRRLDLALTHMPNGLCLFDTERRIVLTNGRFRKMYGLNEADVAPGTPLRSLLERHQANGETSDLDLDEYIRAVMELATQTQLMQDGRTVFIRRRRISEGGWIATHEDITELKKIEERLTENAAQLEQANARFDAAINNMAHGVCLYDRDQTIVVSNRSYAEIYRLSPEQVAPGTTLRRVLEHRESMGTNFKVRADEYIGKNLKLDREVQELADGRIVSISRHGMPDGGWLTTHEDITERARSERRIVYLAEHDLLTGLPNRARFSLDLEDAARSVTEHGGKFAVFMLDLDKFKNVNDTLGHPAGDKLLVEISQRLRASIRDDGILARLGGDEFAIILPIASDDRENAIVLALGIIDVVCQPVELDGQEVSVGTSIGIAFAPADGRTPEDLLKKADLALYSTKANGRNDYRFYEPSMAATADHQKRIENELRDGIANGELEVHYQPIFGAVDKKLFGAEALVRWRHPHRGLLSPDQFIPTAEATGLIVPLGEWVLQRACWDAASWPAELKVSVNLSAVQINKGNLFDVVLCALVDSGLAPERLEFEVTESALLDGQSAHLQTIRQIKNLGISMALDDFGTGYSSASYVTRFPFDKIKIDRAFTQAFVRRKEAAAVIASILALAQGLNMGVTAEGIETEEQYKLLKSAGVDFAQGYLFGRPVAHDVFAAEYLATFKTQVA